MVVTHDSAADLQRLLDSIDAHLDPRPDVVVVDTGSGDGSPDMAAAWGASTRQLGPGTGFGRANNAGLELVREEVTVLLNPDVELLDGGLARLAARAGQEDALLAPRLLNGDGSIQDSAHPAPGSWDALPFALLGPALPPFLRRRAEPWRGEEEVEVGWALAACLAGRTATLRRLGPFDPQAFLFYEDLELGLRAAAAGIPTRLVPSIALRHTGGHSTRPHFGGEAHAVQARRRREVVGRTLGSAALRRDDIAQAVTFTTRSLARRALGRDARRPRAQLAALRAARRG